MLSRTAWFLLGAVVCVGLARLPAATGGEKVKAGGTKKVMKLESKAEQGKSALTVNFAKELDLGFPSLATLGARIEQARSQSDPVSLAFAARELAVAEKVSGKQAAVTSGELIKEAIETAKHRYDATELKALALIADKSSKELKGLAEKAHVAAVEAQKARESGEKTRGIQGRLHADSRVGTTIDVFVDGRHVGTMRPFGDIFPYIGQTPWETTYLSARSRDGRSWSRAVRGATGDYHWILYP